jgi:hypothetical protein
MSIPTKEKMIQGESKKLCQTLLDSEQTYPENTLFRDDIFGKLLDDLAKENEAMVIRDLSPLLVPCALTLMLFGATHLRHLSESAGRGWNSSRPFHGPRPQPDYSVGFGRSAFTAKQLKKLQPYIGENPDHYTSFFMGRWNMYFQFFTNEVNKEALELADLQNAHSMTLAVRGIVELFRLVGRQQELDREVLAFSISNDHETVKFYGHYAVIDGEKTTFYRHLIHIVHIKLLDGRERWTSYRFTRNVYDIWMPKHLDRIRKVINELLPPGAHPSGLLGTSPSELPAAPPSRLPAASSLAPAAASSSAPPIVPSSESRLSHGMKRLTSGDGDDDGDGDGASRKDEEGLAIPGPPATKRSRQR